MAYNEAISALGRYSLVTVSTDTLAVHRLVQTVVRGSLSPEAERSSSAAAIRLLSAAFPSESHKVAVWPECQRLLPHILAAADHGRRLDVEPVVCLWLLHEAAVYLRRRGQYRQALTLHEQVLAGRRRVLGNDHPDTLTAMGTLAEARRNLGELHAARELHELTLAARRRVLGDDHPDTIWTMNCLAEARRSLGDLQAARQLFEQTLVLQPHFGWGRLLAS